MSRNFYSEINLHLIWHTKNSQPLLTPAVEEYTHRYLKQKLIHWPGAFVHAIGGTENHVHVAVSIVPTILISDLVGKLKGSSSHEANRHFGPGRKVLERQSGYGAVSFGTQHLPWVVAYIRNQREHHARGTVEDRLERVLAMDDSGAEAGPEQAP
jgi:putative transposase